MRHLHPGEPMRSLQKRLAHIERFPGCEQPLQKFPERVPATRGAIEQHQVRAATQEHPAAHAESYPALPALDMALAALLRRTLFRFPRPAPATWSRFGFLSVDRFDQYQKTLLPLPACVRDQ